VHEIERHRESLLIVGHQGVLRMILAYFQGVPREEAPHLSLALNHVIKINTTDTTHNLFILFFLVALAHLRIQIEITGDSVTISLHVLLFQ
jgi:broad specificity phosphatase PhoE